MKKLLLLVVVISFVLPNAFSQPILCSSAIPVSDGYEVDHTTLPLGGGPSSFGFLPPPNTAFNQGSGFNHNLHQAIWFKYIGTGNLVEVGTREISGNNDTEILVNSSASGTCAGPWTYIGGVDDPFGGCGASCSKSFLRFFAELGVTYFIAIDGQGDGSVGNYRFYVDELSGEFNPADVTVACGDPGTIQLTGTPGVTLQNIQWQVSPSLGGSYTNLPGETSSTLNFVSVTPAESGMYYRAQYNVFISPSYTGPQASSTGALLTGTGEPCTAPAVPTMSQWGMFLFGLIVFTVALVAGYNLKRRGAVD